MGAEVVDRMGLFSVVSYRMFSTDRILGALNLFGKNRSAFSSDDVHDAEQIVLTRTVPKT